MCFNKCDMNFVLHLKRIVLFLYYIAAGLYLPV